MKHIHKYKDYAIINQYIKDINNAKSINELNEIEKHLETLGLDEGILSFVKRQAKKVKAFFTDAGEAIDYLLSGEEEEEEEEKINYNKETLLIYNEIEGQDTNIYKIYNHDNATSDNIDFQLVFNSYSLKRNLVGDLKKKDDVRVSKYKNLNTDNRIEYVIALYALPDELDVEKELLQYSYIEEVIPSIFIYLKDIKETFDPNRNFNSNFNEFSKDLKDQYRKLLKLPKRKANSVFNDKLLMEGLTSVKIDMKRSK